MHRLLNIAILGTRGIPNQYGGFEQFAEHLSAGLAKRGHEVTVYNPHIHEFDKTDFKGVKIIKKYSPEILIGAAANFFYDYLCLRDALRQDFDIILECGYGTSAVSYYLCPINRSVIVTNMDGLEWKRAKWSGPVKRLMKLFEKWGANKSHALVADNKGIQHHLLKKYGKHSTIIPYGATLFENPDPVFLRRYNLQQNGYYLMIARLEPENNIEMILEGYLKSDSKIPFLVIGNHNTGYGDYLKDRFNHKNIRFLGGIYVRDLINNLRYYSKAYFHGHSVGGTNPSLLEAMACGALIIAHDNEFNNDVLGENGFYFSTPAHVKEHINNVTALNGKRSLLAENTKEQIRRRYNWTVIVDQYETLFEKLIEPESEKKEQKQFILRD